MQLPNRGERYNGPDGPVEVVAVDGAAGTVSVRPDNAPGGEPQVVALADWRAGYVFAPHGADPYMGGAVVNKELTAAARRGYEDRIAGRPAPSKPEGAVDPDERVSRGKGAGQ